MKSENGRGPCPINFLAQPKFLDSIYLDQDDEKGHGLWLCAQTTGSCTSSSSLLTYETQNMWPVDRPEGIVVRCASRRVGSVRAYADIIDLRCEGMLEPPHPRNLGVFIPSRAFTTHVCHHRSVQMSCRAWCPLTLILLSTATLRAFRLDPKLPSMLMTGAT